jgi:hypothetical protein
VARFVLYGTATMTPYVEVTFFGCDEDLSLVAAIHRATARLEHTHAVRRAAIAIRGSRRSTAIDLALTFANGRVAAATISHADSYVAIAQAFQAVEKTLAVAPAAPARRFAAAA